MAYNKVATAPDGVPVYQDEGGKYYTQNADQSYTQQFQGGTPDWLTPQGGAQTPSYYNAQDPTQQAVWSAFQQKGIAPRDQQDFQYWTDKINQSGGLANGYQNTGGSGTWAQRMASANGGVGDYRTGGTPIQGGTMPGAGGAPGQTSAFGDGFGIVNGGGTNTPTTPGVTGDPNQTQSKSDALYADLLARSQQGLGVTANDPALKGQIDANSAATDRASRNYLADLAEKAGPLANLQGEQRLTAEQAGQSEGGFAASLVGNEIAARRTDIQNALTQEGAMLSDQQKNQLTAQLAQLDAASKKYAVDAQSASSKYNTDASSGLGYAQLGNNASQFAANLQNQKDQFGQTLGYNYDQSNQDTNRLLAQLLAQYGYNPGSGSGA
jgi:hypothetical protein